jgi:hypothetical protein
MNQFEGTWIYESFCPARGTSQVAPQLAAPWSPRGVLDVATDPESRKVTGTLKFGPGVELTITGRVTLAAKDLPEGVELIGEGLDSVSELRGFFIPDAGAVVIGTVVATRNDLAKQPIGTRGPFIMFRKAV